MWEIVQTPDFIVIRAIDLNVCTPYVHGKTRIYQWLSYVYVCAWLDFNLTVGFIFRFMLTRRKKSEKNIWIFKIWQHFLLLWKHHLQNHADNTTNTAIFKYWYSLGFYGLKYTLWLKFSRDKSFRYHSVAALKNGLWPQSHSHRQISGAILNK